jgi:hypothetical protein
MTETQQKKLGLAFLELLRHDYMIFKPTDWIFQQWKSNLDPFESKPNFDHVYAVAKVGDPKVLIAESLAILSIYDDKPKYIYCAGSKAVMDILHNLFNEPF